MFSLQAKLISLVTLLVAVVSAFVLYYFPGHLNDQARDALEQRAVDMAEVMAGAAAPSLDFGDDQGVKELLAVLETTPEAAFAVVRHEDGEEVASWRGDETVESGLDPDWESVRVNFDDNKLHVLAPIVTPGQTRGTLHIAFAQDQLREAYNENLSVGLGVSAVILLLGFLMAIGLSRLLARPIGRVTEAAQSLARGDFDTAEEMLGDVDPEAAEESADEATRLTAAFSAMTARLQESQQAIRDYNRKLKAQIDEKEKARRQAEAANEAKSSFLANVSHELRTPLNAIIGYSDLIIEDADYIGCEAVVPDVEKIQKAGNHLLSIINDVLDLSKIESGKTELHYEQIEIEDFVDEIVDTATPLIEENDNVLDVQFDLDGAQFRCDRTKLRQVLINLLGNAAKFTEAGTVGLKVSEQSTEAGAQFVFVVSDTGIGISEDKLDELFDAFTQADSSTTRDYGGTGLGLTLCKKFTTLMKGDIKLESELGEGTTFTVVLPADPDQVAEDRSDPEVIDGTSTPYPDARSLTKTTVLVIDDDPTVHELVDRYFDDEQFELLHATDGKTGLEIAASHRPDLITLDIMMPGTDGWTVLSELKDDDELAEIPVVMISMIDKRKRGYALGADDYLVKPIERETLIDVFSSFATTDDQREVLIIEDEPDLRSFMARSLEANGWSVHTAEDGQVGLDSLEQITPHVILLDLMMPNVDGFEFYQTIQRNEQWRSIPVVVITAMDIDEKVRNRLVGVEKIVEKTDSTWSREEFIEQLEQLVESRLSDDPAPSLPVETTVN